MGFQFPEILPSTNVFDDASGRIQAAIDRASAISGGREVVVRLATGAFYISNPLLLKSYVTLAGSERGESQVLAHGSWALSTADDPLNAFVKAVGTLLGSPASLTASAPTHSTTLSVNSSGYAPGDYAILKGHNNSGDDTVGQSDGSAVVVSEIVQINTVPNGSSVTLKYPTRMYHSGPSLGTAATLQRITPVRQVGVRDVVFDGAGKTVACGFLARNCLRVRIRNLEVANLSRAGADLDLGTEDVIVDGVHGRGTVNGLLFVDSAHHGRVRRLTSAPDGARYHASGIQRGLLHSRNRPMDWVVRDSLLEHAGIGVNLWGGWKWTLDNVIVRDMDSAEAASRMNTASEIQASVVGCGLSTGPSNVPTYGEWLRFLSIRRCVLENLTVHTQGYGWYAADLANAAVDDVKFLNLTGGSWGGVAALDLRDTGGDFRNLHFRGIDGCIDFDNFGHSGSVEWFFAEAGSDVASIHFPFVRFNCTQTGRLLLRNFGTANMSGKIRFPSFSGAHLVTLEKLNLEDCRADVAMLAYHGGSGGGGQASAFDVNDLVELYDDGAGAWRIRQATTGTSRKASVMVGGPYDIAVPAFQLVAPFGANRCTVRASAVDIDVGDIIVYDNANPKRVKADNSVTDPKQILGRSMSRKRVADGVTVIEVVPL